ncbi:MAG: SDR family NAD(P)-dependent oxidoreductase, partial [Steroidobacteraceae bacterium]
MELQGRVAIVTGSGSGIGCAIALGLSREGASVAVADIDAAKAQEVASEIESSGGVAIGLSADVSNSGQVNAMVEETIKRFGRLDILVNNAGRATRGFVGQMSDEDWDAVIAVNLRGTFLCSRAALA